MGFLCVFACVCVLKLLYFFKEQCKFAYCFVLKMAGVFNLKQACKFFRVTFIIHSRLSVTQYARVLSSSNDLKC